MSLGSLTWVRAGGSGGDRHLTSESSHEKGPQGMSRKSQDGEELLGSVCR